MGLYDAFLGSVQDNVIDKAVDGVIDKAKGKVTRENTYGAGPFKLNNLIYRQLLSDF